MKLCMSPKLRSMLNSCIEHAEYLTRLFNGFVNINSSVLVVIIGLDLVESGHFQELAWNWYGNWSALEQILFFKHS